MSLKPGEDIGPETHPGTDQFIRVEDGMGKAILDRHAYEVEDGSAIVIPAGTEHNVMNISSTEWPFSTIWAVPKILQDRTKTF
jgi:mannose-6-phosphate isomerase-like protein (cupin superfamily)